LQTHHKYSSSYNNRAYYSILGLVALILVVPNWIVRYVPLVDYPSHLARAYATAMYSVIPAYREHYALHYSLIPNLGSDLLLPPLMKFLPMAIAGKALLSLIAIAFVYGCHSLGRAVYGRPTWLSIIASFLVLNSLYFWGNINSVFGLGLFLIAYSLWLRWKGKWNPARAVIFSTLVCVCYIVHLSAFAILMASIVSRPIVQKLRPRTNSKAWIIAVVAITCVVSVFLWIAQPQLPGIPHIEWTSPQNKLVLLFSPFASYSRVFDVVYLLSIFFIVVLTLWKSKFRLRSSLLIPTITLLLVGLLLPSTIGRLNGIDIRALPIVFVLLGLSLDITDSGRWLAVAFVAMFILQTTRVVEVAEAWSRMSDRIERHVELIDRIPQQATLYPIVYEDYFGSRKEERPLMHVASYAIADRQALVGNQWDNILSFRTARAQYLFYSDSSLQDYNWHDLFSYDYLWTYHPNSELLDTLCAHARVVSKYESAYLFQVHK
jgi:hypothetical protein